MTTQFEATAADLGRALQEADRLRAANTRAVRTIEGLREDLEHASNVAMGTAMALGIVLQDLLAIGGLAAYCAKHHGGRCVSGCALPMSLDIADLVSMLAQSPEPTP